MGSKLKGRDARKLRELTRMVEDEGAELVEVKRRGTGHLLLRISRSGWPNEVKVTCPNTPSCPRSMMNVRSVIRRLIREQEGA